MEKFESAQKALTRAFTKLKEDNSVIPIWWPTGRTVLLPKTKNLEDEKNYRPITCFEHVIQDNDRGDSKVYKRTHHGQ